jgi:hypothetical protein
MPTLQELLTREFSGGTEKIASEQPAAQEPTQDEIVKVAQEFGLYEMMFPEDKTLTAPAEKTAEEKLAEAEMALGARAHDHFVERLNLRLEKLAGEIMGASDLEAAQGILQPEARPPQAVPTNSDPALDKMPLNPVKETPYGVAAGTEAGAEAPVGHFEQKMASAIQKAFLKRALGI